MNEKYSTESTETIETTEESSEELLASEETTEVDVPGSATPTTEVPVQSVENDESNSDILSPETSERVSTDVSSGDVVDRDVSVGDADPDGNGFNNRVMYSEISSPDYMEAFSSIQLSLDVLNSTLVLILIFLLLSWTDKKLSVIVRKFTRERRK